MGSYLFLAVRALALVVIAASLWPFLADAYDGLVVTVAGGFLPGEIAVRAGEGRIYLDFLSGNGGVGLSIQGFVLHFGLILVMALVVSTPGLGLARMATWLVGAAGLFVAAHILGVSLFVWGLWLATYGGQSVVTVGGTMAAFAIFWASLPAVVGGAWCYWFWLPALRHSVRKSQAPVGDALESRQA